MEMMRCMRCRAPLHNAEEEQKTVKCEYCDYTNIRPKYHKENRYNIANRLREEAEFDKAIEEYGKLLAEDEADYTAHWGILLCKYGIEYVEDPATGKILPTCHLDRIQEESIQKEPHYIAALEYADDVVKVLYTEEAKQIDEIRADIMAATKNQEPYDVFICYKSKDEWKHRTEDSVWAQDIYEELTKRDYRVFFADKTIELGMKYEPVIFHALYSAAIMIVVGTKEEYLNSIWVKNEWSRYAKLTKTSDKSIFLAYKDMDPNRFPVTLRPWQAQDLAQIGAMQDLISAVEKKLKGNGASKGSESQGNISYVEGLEVNKCARLLKNGETFLKLDNYEEAEEVYRTITKEYPEEYRGWWGLIVCKTRNFKRCDEDVSADKVIVDEQTDTWYRYVKRLAPSQEFTELEKIYLKYVDEHVAWRYVNKYVKLTKCIIEEKKELIVLHKKKIEVIEAARKKSGEDALIVLDDLEAKEEESKQQCKNLNSQIKWKTNRWHVIFISIAIILLACIWGSTGDMLIVGGGVIVCVMLGVVLLLLTWISDNGVSKSQLEQELEIAQSTILINQNNREQLRKNYAADLEEFAQQIDLAKKNITKSQSDIWEQTKLLERGEEEIHKEFYEKLCKIIRNI